MLEHTSTGGNRRDPGYEQWLDETGADRPLTESEAEQMEADFRRAELECSGAASDAERLRNQALPAALMDIAEQVAVGIRQFLIGT